MLAACAEAEPGEEALVALGRDSQARWPAFAEELEQASGIDVELRREGTLVIALTADDQARSFIISSSKRSSIYRCNGFPPPRPDGASPILPASWPARCSARRIIRSTTANSRSPWPAAKAAGAGIHEHQPVAAISSQGRRVDGIVLADGTKHAADVVVLAAGAWSRGIAGSIADVAPQSLPPVRPIKGQMLALRMDRAAPLVSHVIWGPGIYLVPRLDGRLIIGATVEERGFNSRSPPVAC